MDTGPGPIPLLAITKVVSVPIVAGAVNLDLLLAGVFNITVSANITAVAVLNPTVSSNYQNFYIQFTGSGTAFTQTWPGSWTWTAGVPVLSSGNGKRDLAHIRTFDGVNYLASMVGQNY